jgi:hypothetical protein
VAKVDFGAQRKQAEDAGMLGGGGFYKLKEGDNRIRLASICLPHTSDFNGKKSFKWLCYVIDRRDGAVKPFFMSHMVYKAIEALQSNPDYFFEEVPMPYDLTIHAKGAGTIDVEYSLIPARKEVPLTEDEQAAIHQAKPLAELQQAILDKQAKAKGQTQTDDAQHEPQSAEAEHLAGQVRRVMAGEELSDKDIPF